MGIVPCFMQTIPVDEDLQNEFRAFQEKQSLGEQKQDGADQELYEYLRTMNEDMVGQDIDQKEDFETRENPADIEQQDLDEILRTIDENMEESEGDENVDFETRENSEDTDIESVLEEETRTFGELTSFSNINNRTYIVIFISAYNIISFFFLLLCM